MTKPKSAPAAAPAESPEDAIVTSTGRVRAETKIKVEDFTEGEGGAEFDVYSRDPEVTVTETERNGRKITIESYD